MDNIEDDKPDLGPGQAYAIFLKMEDLLEKLKLLDYDMDFLKKSHAYKPLSRTYFAQQTNPGEQFYMFTNLAAWLIQKTGNFKFAMPEEYDDPNATISGIINELRKLDISIDFSSNRLKSGHGEQCIFVLHNLADLALKKTEFQWKYPIFPKVEQLVDEVVATLEQENNGSEGVAEEGEFSMEEGEESDDEADFLNLDGLKSVPTYGKKIDTDWEEKCVLKSDVDLNEWKMEVERVTPSLKIIVRQDAKDWRSHLEQINTHKKNLDETFGQVQPNLERLTEEIGKNLEKIDSREKYLNTQLESMLSEFRLAKDRCAEVKERYLEASGGLTERTKLLAQITEDLEQTKGELEERSLNLTDGAPLVKAKQALTRLQQEILAIDVAIGVLEQTHLQSQMRDRTNLQADLRDNFFH